MTTVPTVTTVTRLQAGQSQFQFPSGARGFYLLHKVQTHSRPHPTSCSIGNKGSFPAERWLRRAADHSTPCTISGAVPLYLHTSICPVSLHGTYRDNCNFVSITAYLQVIDNTQAHSKDHMDHTKYDGQLHFVWVKEDNLVSSCLQHDINMLAETTPATWHKHTSRNNSFNTFQHCQT